MKKVKRIAIVVVLILSVTIPSIRALTASDLDDQATYNKWKETCSTAYSKNKEACAVLAAYVEAKKQEAQNSIDEQKKDLESLNISIQDVQAQISKYVTEINTLQENVNAVAAEISTVESSIVALNAQIETRLTKIQEMDDLIRERLVGMESYIGTNLFFEFLLSSNDFADLLTRWDSISVITKGDQDLVDQLNAEKVELENDKVQLDVQKLALDEQKTTYQTRLNDVQQMQASLDKAYQRFLAQQTTLSQDISTNERTQAQMDEVINSFNDIGNIPSSTAWLTPTTSHFQISAVAWAYPEGGWHAGVDIAPSPRGIGAPALAPANGVVVYSSNGCDSWNSYYCGDPSGIGSTYGGNQVYMIVSVEGSVYGIAYKHLMNGSAVSPREVNAGDQVGQIGNSGQSTGPHLHIEAVYLGTDTLDYYVRNWRNGNFGASGSSRLCENGYGAPCRVKPQTLWGYSLYQRY